MQIDRTGIRKETARALGFRDSGLLHALMGVRDEGDLLTHPKSGASWEGFLLEQALRIARPDEAYFWATHAGAELDLLMMKHGHRIGVEIKRADAPALTPSMRIAMHDLKLTPGMQCRVMTPIGCPAADDYRWHGR